MLFMSNEWIPLRQIFHCVTDLLFSGFFCGGQVAKQSNATIIMATNW
jgi:hypothetical protein